MTNPRPSATRVAEALKKLADDVIRKSPLSIAERVAIANAIDDLERKAGELAAKAWPPGDDQ